MSAASLEPTAEDLRIAVAHLTSRLAASTAVNAALLELIDNKNVEIRRCHDEIVRLARENEDLEQQRDRAQQRAECGPHQWPLRRSRIGNRL